LSVTTLRQARETAGTDVDYLGVGPVFATASKADAAPPTGLSIFREMAEAGIRTPSYAIGGIQVSNAEEVLAAGAWGLAVISAVVAAPDPLEAARAFVDILGRHPR
jgi:thiamine-phosphate diphosphorylase